MTPDCAAGPLCPGIPSRCGAGLFLCPKARRPNAYTPNFLVVSQPPKPVAILDAIRSNAKKAAHLSRLSSKLLFTKTQFLDQRVVALNILTLKVRKKLTALVDHHQKAAARVVIFMVALKVIGEVADTLREDRDLNFWAARVAIGAGVVFDNFGFLFGRNRHIVFFLLSDIG